ncbi:MAG: histidine phosphatase family protein [Bdellovibrionales bacterium]
MKQLLILRHAQALGTEIGGSDKTRKLSPNGHADAKALGKCMVKDELRPDLVLCSSAVRTRETLADVLNSYDDLETHFIDQLYNSDFLTLKQNIHEISDDVQSLMIVAHNPGIHELAARLAMDDGSSRVERLLLAYMPATLTVLTCKIERWSDLVDYSNVVSALYETSEYNASDRPTRWM